MLKLFLWLRYLRKRRIVLLSVAAVAFSCALLIVVDSLFTGFIAALAEADIEGEGDMILIPRLAAKYEVLAERIERIEGVAGAGPVLYGGGLLRFGKGDVREAYLVGTSAEHESRDSDLRGSLLRQSEEGGELSFDVPGHPGAVGGWVGIGVVSEPSEETDEYDLEEVRKLIGEEIVLTTFGRVREGGEGEGFDTKVKLKRKVLRFRVSDIFYSGMYHRDKNLYLPYDEFYRISFGEDEVRAANIKIRVEKSVEAESLRGEVWGVWEDFAREELGYGADEISSARLWVSDRSGSEFFAELRKQMAVLLLIFGVICSVAVLLVFCIFYMIVESKRKDIAIIKSCGSSRGAAGLIFIGFGACVGVVGSLFGIILGYIVTRNINILEEWVRVLFGMKLWRSSVYMFERIPNEVDWSSVWWIVLIAIGGCVLGSLIPAIVAARVEPVKILRYE